MKDPAWIEIVPETNWANDDSLGRLLEKVKDQENGRVDNIMACLLYTSPSPRD